MTTKLAELAINDGQMRICYNLKTKSVGMVFMVNDVTVTWACSPESARDMAKSLIECADMLEKALAAN